MRHSCVRETLGLIDSKSHANTDRQQQTGNTAGRVGQQQTETPSLLLPEISGHSDAPPNVLIEGINQRFRSLLLRSCLCYHGVQIGFHGGVFSMQT